VSSLREIKDRIGSVRSTLKITSAMKLVASAKLRKAQRAIEGMRPYERTLAEILAGTALYLSFCNNPVCKYQTKRHRVVEIALVPERDYEWRLSSNLQERGRKGLEFKLH